MTVPRTLVLILALVVLAAPSLAGAQPVAVPETRAGEF
jgi:hypothetical protein